MKGIYGDNENNDGLDDYRKKPNGVTTKPEVMTKPALEALGIIVHALMPLNEDTRLRVLGAVRVLLSVKGGA